MALQFANDNLKNDEEFTIKILKKGYSQQYFRQTSPQAINNIIDKLLITDTHLVLEILKKNSSLVRSINISKKHWSNFTNALYESIVPKEAIVHLIWFGSLPPSYFKNIEKIVIANPGCKIFLWINEGKRSHTLSVINQSTISETLIQKIHLRSFDEFISEPTKIDAMDSKDTRNNYKRKIILEARHLYYKYSTL